MINDPILRHSSPAYVPMSQESLQMDECPIEDLSDWSRSLLFPPVFHQFLDVLIDRKFCLLAELKVCDSRLGAFSSNGFNGEVYLMGEDLCC